MFTDSEREMLALLIGQQVRDGRKRLGLSQIELSHGLGSQSMISLIESGRQLPLPDVLHLLAERLDDEMLRQYESMLSSGEIDFGSITEMNHSVLLGALRSQRGRWQDVYGKVAIQLCEHHYTNRIFGTCREICQLIDAHCESSKILALSHYYHGSTFLVEDRFDEAQTWLRKAESLQDWLDRSMQGKLMYNLAYLYTSLDIQGMAMWYANMAVDKFSQIHDFPRQSKALGILGTVQYRIGLLDDAQASLCLAMDIGQKWSIPNMDCARIACTLAETYWELGNLPRAKESAELAIETAAQCNDSLSLSGAYRTKYLALNKIGNVQEASEYLEKAIEVLENTEELPFGAHTYLLYAETRSSGEEKIAVAQRAYDYATKTRSAIEEAFAAEYLATLHDEQNRPETAAHYRKLALSAYRKHVYRDTMFRDIARVVPNS